MYDSVVPGSTDHAPIVLLEAESRSPKTFSAATQNSKSEIEKMAPTQEGAHSNCKSQGQGEGATFAMATSDICKVKALETPLEIP